MTAKYFINNNGEFIGTFVDGGFPDDAIEVDSAPQDARQKYTNGVWSDINSVYTYIDKRLGLDGGNIHYASLEEQNDMRYRDAMNGTTEWKDHITLVKTTYPKG